MKKPKKKTGAPITPSEVERWWAFLSPAQKVESARIYRAFKREPHKVWRARNYLDLEDTMKETAWKRICDFLDRASSAEVMKKLPPSLRQAIATVAFMRWLTAKESA